MHYVDLSGIHTSMLSVWYTSGRNTFNLYPGHSISVMGGAHMRCVNS